MRPWSDERMELFIGNLLRRGVFLAAALVLAGTVLTLLRGAAAPDYGVFHGEPAALRSVSGTVRAALALEGPAVTQLGLLVLIATPLARVVFSVFAFAAQRDRLYVAITLGVLAVLGWSLVWGA